MIGNFAHILRVSCELLPQLVVFFNGTLVSYLNAISLRLKITKFCLLISLKLNKSVQWQLPFSSPEILAVFWN